jgi:hypothetical protein
VFLATLTTENIVILNLLYVNFPHEVSCELYNSDLVNSRIQLYIFLCLNYHESGGNLMDIRACSPIQNFYRRDFEEF